MQMAAFNAVCQYEIGDKVKVAIPVQGEDGQKFSVEVATITDIACTHYVKKGKIVFTYELNHNGHYGRLMGLKDAVKRD